jgi:membrane protein required for colicin V production
MATVDWAILIIMLLAVLGGLSQGFFRSVCALGGLVLGLVLAAWNYGRIAALLMPLFHIEPVADTFGFVFIALVVMGLAGLAGSIMAKTLHYLGLGCLDRIAGGVFGFLQGALLITLGILVIVAFYPEAHWLAEAKLPKMFFGACRVSTHMSPAELAEKVRHGLQTLEDESPKWLHPDHGKL